MKMASATFRSSNNLPVTSGCDEIQTTVNAIVRYFGARDARFGVEVIFKFTFDVSNDRLPAATALNLVGKQKSSQSFKRCSSN